jgi:enoyl-[acyl-carrier protein] reductase I
MGWKNPPIQRISESGILLCKTRTRKTHHLPASLHARIRRLKVQPTSDRIMGFLDGKRLLITGVLNNRSIAYGIARACHREGAELAFSYQGERFKDRITEFAAEFGSKLVFECDVGDDAQIERLFADLGQSWPQFDGFVHAIAYAPRESIAGDFLDGLSRESFRIAHDISAYSFPAMAKAALPRLRTGAALLTLSYLGAIRYVPHYNTMGLAKASLEASVRFLAQSLGGRGIRVNGLSAGPIKTLAASGIKDFGKLLSLFAATTPIRRPITIDDVGNVAAFLLSDLAAGISAEITYVDGGYSQMAIGNPEA